MGGHAAFIWPVYGMAAVVLGGFLFVSLRSLRAREREVDALEKTSPRRGGGNSS